VFEQVSLDDNAWASATFGANDAGALKRFHDGHATQSTTERNYELADRRLVCRSQPRNGNAAALSRAVVRQSVRLDATTPAVVRHPMSASSLVPQ
jgi:hypothetical protein